MGTTCLSRGQEQAPPCSQQRVQAVKDSPSAGRICVVLGEHMKVPGGGEAGAVTDLALTNRGESLADLVKQLSGARLQLGHFVLKSTVRQFLLLFLYTV